MNQSMETLGGKEEERARGKKKKKERKEAERNTWEEDERECLLPSWKEINEDIEKRE